MTAASTRWYREGLRFSCSRCGHCCVGPGTVRVSEAEIERLAIRLGLEAHEFRAMYTRRLRGGDVGLRERGDRSCVFHAADRGCRVYPDRPRQCRTWPFWDAVVASPERWLEEARDCPGMNRGALHAADRIERTAAADGTRNPAPPR